MRTEMKQIGTFKKTIGYNSNVTSVKHILTKAELVYDDLLAEYISQFIWQTKCMTSDEDVTVYDHDIEIALQDVKNRVTILEHHLNKIN